MSLGHHYKYCPRCLVVDIHELMRIEAGEIGNDEDLAVYKCNECSYEWDHELEMKKDHFKYYYVFWQNIPGLILGASEEEALWVASTSEDAIVFGFDREIQDAFVIVVTDTREKGTAV